MRRWVALGPVRSTGIALFAHWTVLLAILVLVAGGFEAPAYAAVTFTSLIVLVVGHEAGHALLARRLGYSVDSIRIALVHGSCQFEAPDTEWDEVVISWGGIAVQLSLAIPLLAIDFFWRGPLGLLGPVIVVLGYYSLAVAAFNLIPAEGLDGKSAWRIVPLVIQRAKAKRLAKDAIRRASRRP